MTVLLFILAGVLPCLFSIYGRRWLGKQTHPAALFILAWMAVAFLLDAAMPSVPVAVLAFAWVLLCFGAVAMVRKFRPGTNDASKAE